MTEGALVAAGSAGEGRTVQFAEPDFRGAHRLAHGGLVVTQCGVLLWLRLRHPLPTRSLLYTCSMCARFDNDSRLIIEIEHFDR